MSPVDLPAAARPTRRHALRLAWVAGEERRLASELLVQGRWKLRGVQTGASDAGVAGLARLWSGLGPGEVMQFTHDFSAVDGAVRYSLGIDLLSSVASGSGTMADELAAALSQAAPVFWFESRDVAAPKPDWPLRTVWRPAGVRLWAGRERGRGSDADERPVDRVPYPAAMPDWPLTVPLESLPPTLTGLRIVQRVRSFRLDDVGLHRVHALMNRLKGGNLRCFRPQSPLHTHCADPGLRQPTIELLQSWLVEPAGYAFDVLVYSAEGVPAAALQGVASDIFGRMPFEALDDCAADAAPEFSAATLAAQGAPAVLPGAEAASSGGIARFFAGASTPLPQAGFVIGSTAAGPRRAVVRLNAASRLQHVGIIGSSGGGKSTLMEAMMAREIADPDRACSVVLIDPAGDLANKVLDHVPPARTGDVVIVDVGDAETTACLNPLQGMRDDPMLSSFAASQIGEIIDMQLEGRDTTGPQTRSHIHHLLRLAGSRTGFNGTFLDALRILEDAEFRSWMLGKCGDPALVGYWKRFVATSGDHGFGNWLPYLQARLAPFTSSPILKRLLCRPDSSFNLRRAMDERKIIVFNLDKGVLQDVECRMLGAVLLMMLRAAAMSRSRQPQSERVPCHVYIDEFASFAGDSASRLFAESRKYALGLCVSLQQTSQLGNRWGREPVLDAVLANTAQKFIFRLAPTDAGPLAPYYQPALTPAGIVNLPDFHTVATLSERGARTAPFVMKVDLPDPASAPNCADVVRRESARRYGTTIEAANAELMKLYDIPAHALRSALD